MLGEVYFIKLIVEFEIILYCHVHVIPDI